MNKQQALEVCQTFQEYSRKERCYYVQFICVVRPLKMVVYFLLFFRVAKDFYSEAVVA